MFGGELRQRFRDLFDFNHTSQRNTMLGFQQIIMLAELAVSRALDNTDPLGQ
jgi:hypothetical protein